MEGLEEQVHMLLLDEAAREQHIDLVLAGLGLLDAGEVERGRDHGGMREAGGRVRGEG